MAEFKNGVQHPAFVKIGVLMHQLAPTLNRNLKYILLKDGDFSMVPKVSHNSSATSVAKPAADKPTTWRVAFPPSEGFFDAVIQFKEDEIDKRVVWVTDIAEINRTVDQTLPCHKEDIYQGALVAAPLYNYVV